MPAWAAAICDVLEDVQKNKEKDKETRRQRQGEKEEKTTTTGKELRRLLFFTSFCSLLSCHMLQKMRKERLWDMYWRKCKRNYKFIASYDLHCILNAVVQFYTLVQFKVSVFVLCMAIYYCQQGIKLTLCFGSHWASKYSKVVANSKKLVAIMTHTQKSTFHASINFHSKHDQNSHELQRRH